MDCSLPVSCVHGILQPSPNLQTKNATLKGDSASQPPFWTRMRLHGQKTLARKGSEQLTEQLTHTCTSKQKQTLSWISVSYFHSQSYLNSVTSICSSLLRFKFFVQCLPWFSARELSKSHNLIFSEADIIMPL